MIEILFTAFNRFAYTRCSFELLRQNTDWSFVDRLVVYDDGSTDGTTEWLQEVLRHMPVPSELWDGGWGSIAATMNDYVERTDAKHFVKIDNDIAMPPGWLERLLEASERHPKFELVGMEAGISARCEGVLPSKRYSIVAASYIGGVGLMRTSAMRRCGPLPVDQGRAAFTLWQMNHPLVVGWLKPDLPNVQLDKVPSEPWASLAKQYVEKEWARPWPAYRAEQAPLWEWLPREVSVAH